MGADAPSQDSQDPNAEGFETPPPNPPRLERSKRKVPYLLDDMAGCADDDDEDDEEQPSKRARKQKNPKKKTAYLYKSKSHSLTWPQAVETPKSEIMEALHNCVAKMSSKMRSGSAEIEMAFIAKENHKDGNTHYHAYVKTTKAVYVYPESWDWTTKISTAEGERTALMHGNYQSTKCVKDWVEYIQKDDPDVLCFGKTDIKTVIRARKSHTAVFCQKVLEAGAITQEILHDHPEMLLKLDVTKRNLELYNDMKCAEAARVAAPNTWYSWQKSCLDFVTKPISTEQSKREITWFIDYEGNNGKTFLAKFLVANHRAYYVNGGKRADIIHAWRGEQIVVFDFSREKADAMEGMYGCIEQIKNGIAFSGKYESRVKNYPVPWVICFSNWRPDTDKLSDDRWGQGPYNIVDKVAMTDSGEQANFAWLFPDSAIDEMIDDLLDS